MKLGPHIISAPKIFYPYIGLSNAKGFLIFKWIFLRSEIYNDLTSNKPDPRNIAILIHENVHLERSREIGQIRFWGKYVFTNQGRLEEELLAYGKQMKYLKGKGLEYDISRVAKALSSWVYLWCCPYTEAKAGLEKIWAEAK